MKVKLIIAETFCEDRYYDYDNDGLRQFSIEDYSGFEEVDDNKLRMLEEFVRDFNRDKKNRGIAFLLKEPQRITMNSAIDMIVEKRKREEKERREEELRCEKQRAERNRIKQLKAVERKKKQLDKLKRELDII